MTVDHTSTDRTSTDRATTRPDTKAAARAVTIGLDVGTSGLKAVAVDASGGTVAEAHASYPLLTPRPGWTEQRPEDWWSAACDAIRSLLREVPADAVTAVGVSGQMHGLVALDEEGRPVRPALLWNDQRTGAQVAAIESAVSRSELVRRTGNPAVTGFQLPKLLWLHDEEPGRYASVRTVLFPKDWLTHRLTGERVSESTDASGSGAFSVGARDWDVDLLARLGIDAELFPPLVPSDGVAGRVSRDGARATGLLEGTPVVAGAGDNAAAAMALGLGLSDLDTGSVSLGTSGVLFVPLAAPAPDPLGRVHLFAHADGGWTALGVTLAAAGSLAWWLRTVAPGADPGAVVQRALTRPTGAGGVTFTPYLAGERSPFLDPALRGGFAGLSLSTHADDLVRAVLEGVAFSLADVAAVMRPIASPSRLLATGGGARGDGWVQLLADLLEVEIGIPTAVPGAAHGAAQLAWRSAGVELPPPAVDRWLAPAPNEALAVAYARYRKHAPPLDVANEGPR